MDRGLALAATVVVGGLIALQAPINGNLGRTIGAGGVTAATIAGQLAASVVIDRLGLFGLDVRPLSLQRVAGLALLTAGTLLIVRE